MFMDHVVKAAQLKLHAFNLDSQSFIRAFPWIVHQQGIAA